MIRIGISSCLLGNKVRYDGSSKMNTRLVGLSTQVEWVPVCPETEAGMPVPREPMQLVDSVSGLRLEAIRTREDRTEQLMRWTGQKIVQLEELGLSGFVFKARSPSCALSDAVIVKHDDAETKKGSGLFARELARRFPGLPLADETITDDENRFAQFFARVHAAASRT
jgi:uncharacterized protein YbbK (DUF523 family)